MLPWDPPPARSTDDPRHALLTAARLSPRLLTPGMTEDYLCARIAEADTRAHELTNRVGWLTWGIRSGHWPHAHPQLRARRTATPPAPPTPAPPPVMPAPVFAEHVAWQQLWSFGILGDPNVTLPFVPTSTTWMPIARR